MRTTRLLGLVSAAITVLLASPRVEAFCRATSCDPAKRMCAFDEHGCEQTGVAAWWRRTPIRYRFHAAGSARVEREDEARNAIRSAFNRWSDVHCEGRRTSLRFQEDREDATGPLKGNAEPFTIYFRDDSWPYANAHNTLAKTTLEIGEHTGRISSGIVEINTHTTSFATRDESPGHFDLEAVMTHEVGHYIGLSHSDDSESIMAPTYCPSAGEVDTPKADRCRAGNVEMRRLWADDEAGVCSLYPPDGPVRYMEETPEPPSCAAGHGASPPTPSAALVAALGALAGWRRFGPRGGAAARGFKTPR